MLLSCRRLAIRLSTSKLRQLWYEFTSKYISSLLFYNLEKYIKRRYKNHTRGLLQVVSFQYQRETEALLL